MAVDASTGLILLAAAFTLVAFLTPFCKVLCRHAGLIDRPGARKIHSQPVPYGGGIAVVATFTAMVLVFFQFAHVSENPSRAVNPGHVTPTIAQSDLTVLLCGGGAMFLLGLVDDWKRLSARIKLLIQLVIVVCVVLGGIRANFFSPQPWVGTLVSILWILGITNALNLLDNMNGQCPGVTAIAASCFFAITALTGQCVLSGIMAIVAGSALGFLPHNFPNATVFLGNAGSYFLGYLLATLTTLGTYYFEYASYPLVAVAVPVLVLAVPLFDTSSVILIRFRLRKPIFEGDTNHFAHRLVALGLSPTQAVLAVFLLTAITGLAAVTLYFVSTLAGALLVLGIIGLVLILVVLLEQAARRHQPGP